MANLVQILAPALLLAAASSAAEEDFVCGAPGYYADPSDCANFFQCAAGHPDPYLFVCSSGTLFDDAALVCDHDEDVDCGDRPVDGGGATAAPGTTAKAGTTAKVDTTVKQTTVKQETTAKPEATTAKPDGSTGGVGGYSPRPMPAKALGLYLAVSADNDANFRPTGDDWTPALYDYQKEAANVLYLTFVNPRTMAVPAAFANLAAGRGTAFPSDTVLMFAVGGYSYSLQVNPWWWLESRAAAEEMAEAVARWPELYGCDGVDLDIEEGAGDRPAAAANLPHFVRRLKELSPGMVVGQPAYGYPAVAAPNGLINESWGPDGSDSDLADSVGIMVYEGTQSLDYVPNYAEGADQYEGFPITASVPRPAILVGAKGTAAAADYAGLAEACVADGLGGVMVWYASVANGPQYDPSWDLSSSPEAVDAVYAAYDILVNSV